MDPNGTFTPDILPGQLGLTEAEVQLCAQIIEEARKEPVPCEEITGALELIIVGADHDIAPLEGALNGIKEQYGMLLTSVAMRAYAAGKKAIQSAAKAEDQAD